MAVEVMMVRAKCWICVCCPITRGGGCAGIACQLARRGGVVVVVVDYRLAPGQSNALPPL